MQRIDLGAEVDKAKWPPGVRPISWSQMDALGVDNDGLLYWHGKPVEIRRSLTLTFWQSAGGAFVSGSAVVIAVIELIRLGKEMHWWLQ